MPHVNIRISGMVQGVFFRSSAKYKADALDIKGFARNEPDGTVYIEAESPVQAVLDDFIAWCKIGPPSSDVDDVSVSTADPVNFTRFSIVH